MLTCFHVHKNILSLLTSFTPNTCTLHTHTTHMHTTHNTQHTTHMHTTHTHTQHTCTQHTHTHAHMHTHTHTHVHTHTHTHTHTHYTEMPLPAETVDSPPTSPQVDADSTHCMSTSSTPDLAPGRERLPDRKWSEPIDFALRRTSAFPTDDATSRHDWVQLNVGGRIFATTRFVLHGLGVTY